MKKRNHSDLVRMYKAGENTDNPLYAEQRSNLMLVAGNHYLKKGSKYWSRARDERNGMNSDQRIRITKNHIQRICKLYENNILSFAPAVEITAKNENEMSDQKAAELNNAVWQDISVRLKMPQRNREFCQDFVRIGEAFVKIYWDETKGKLDGYAPSVDTEGQQHVDENGQPVPDMTKPVFTGDIVFERIFGFNIFRDPQAKNLDDSPYIGYRKMVSVEELKMRVKGDEEKLKYVQESQDETFMIWDNNNFTYGEGTSQCLVLEVYFRPCLEYPKGYYYIYTLAGILFEGELPFGVFPIVHVGFDEVPTNPRFHSIIKHLRPFQAEINRASSKVAEHQITLADDKLLIQAGTKIQNGGNFPGVRAYQYAGAAPTILPGRAGDQFFSTIEKNIQEMYIIANLKEDLEEKSQQIDPTSMLFASIEQKKKYMIYATKFMAFLIQMAETALELTKQYIPDDSLIAKIGRSEIVNIPEFKNTKPLCYQIKVTSGSDDMETKLGKHLIFSQAMQYIGPNMDKNQLGQLFRLTPYANNEELFSDMTINYDNATNMLLALDRGEMMEPNEQDDSGYMLQKLVARTRKADFKFLPPQTQDLYAQVYKKLTDIQAAQQMKIQEASLGFIPMSGMAVVCDLYVPDPHNASKQMRARVPYDSLMWLLKRLETQGVNQEGMMQQQQGALASISEKILGGQQQQQMGTPQEPQQQPQQMMPQ